MQPFKKIVVVAIDTLNVDHLGCYGYRVPKTPTTPFLDRLAANGARFNAHYATDVPTPPSYTAFLYGVRGIRNGIVGFNNRVSEFRCPSPSLAACFAERGYRTGMISNLLNIGRWYAAGFQDITVPGLRFQGGAAEDVTDDALRWLRHHGDGDFLLFVHYWDPHVPYFGRSRPEYRAMFPPDPYKAAAPDMRYFEANELLRKIYENKHRVNGDPLEPEKNLACYDANIRYTDDQISRLYGALEEAGLAEDTLVVVTSDHGEAFGEYGFFDHWSAYRNISQLPLILHGRGISRQVFDSYTQNVDVMPTLLELAGLDTPGNLCGRTLVPLLAGQADSVRDLAVTNTDATVIQRMLVKDGYALMRTFSRPIWDHIREFELFDLRKDPDQLHDIAAEEEARTKAMRLELEDWTAQTLQGMPDPLQLSLFRGGCGIWGWALNHLEPADLAEARRRYPELNAHTPIAW
ncbi:MAG: sulfatase [Lentisphaerae bacterium]|nr:sulfatase [Lentisphaerota bacterium]